MIEQIKQTADFIKSKVSQMPQTAIILGTGLGELVNHIDITEELNYQDIPNFPISTVEGHSGKLIFGQLGKKRVMAMQGRFHFYEGYNMHDIMIITDHINLFPEHPLRGKNYDELGPRFPDMGEAYSKRLIKDALNVAAQNGIVVRQGVYVGTQGPTFETPAEYRYFRTIGGDAVGMSTVPEVIVARHSGMEVFAVSVITDLGGMDEPEKVSHEEVQKAAAEAQPKMTAIMKGLINEFKD